MAVVTVNSSVVNDILNGVKANGNLDRGNTLTSKGFVNVGATDSSTSTYFLCSLPSNIYINILGFYNTTLTVLGADSSYSIGLVSANTSSPNFVSLPNLFATNISLKTVRTLADFRFTNLNLNTFEQPLWQLAGLSQDFGGYYYLTVTANQASDNGGTIAAMVQYSAN